MGPIFFFAFGCFQSVPISEFWPGTERNLVFPRLGVKKGFSAKVAFLELGIFTLRCLI